jgi:tetratricopeptide (TPR) repeat protein
VPARRRWGLPVALALAGLAALAALTPVVDSDIWWHLAAGREMVATRRLLTVDPFSLSAAGRPWIDVHWLFQLGAFALHALGGLLALVAAKAALVAAGALILLAAVTRAVPDDARAAARAPLLVALPAALLAARHLLLVRPVILTLVFLALFLLVLEDHRAGGRARRLLWLPGIQVVWANCQGLSALGPALVAAAALGGLLAQATGGRELPARGTRQLLGALAMCLLASAVTPYGLRALALPLELLSRLAPDDGNVFSANIAENVPPWVLERSQPGQLLPLGLALAAVAGSFAVARGQRVFGRALAVAGFAALALMANRNVLLFYWVAVPLAVMNAAPAAARLHARLRARQPRLAGLPAAVTGLAVLLAAGAGGAALRAETPLYEPAPFRIPAGAALRIAAGPGGGRVFAADHYGGYLIWTLYPLAKPYIDTRLVLRTADEYAEFLALADYPARFAAFDRRHRFDWVALPTVFPDRYLGLVQTLARDPAWRLVYTDGSETLFARSEAGSAGVDLGTRTTTEAIAATLEQRHGGQPAVLAAARRHLARLDLALGHNGEARHLLAAMPATDFAARALLARSHLLAGDTATAEAMAQRLLADADDPVPALNLLALAALSSGRSQQALEYLRRALHEDPYDPEARGILEQLSEPAAR